MCPPHVRTRALPALARKCAQSVARLLASRLQEKYGGGPLPLAKAPSGGENPFFYFFFPPPCRDSISSFETDIQKHTQSLESPLK